MKHRRAVSMVELLLVLSASTVLLTLTGMLLQRSMRIHMQSRARVNTERTVLRLSTQFRQDVHQARTAVTRDASGKDELLRLELANGRAAIYSRSEGNVLRLESGGGKPVWREAFVLPASSTLTIDEKNEPPRLILTVSNVVSSNATGDSMQLAGRSFIPVSLHAVAVIGRDLRVGLARAKQEAAP
jgi:hypothetical protein